MIHDRPLTNRKRKKGKAGRKHRLQSLLPSSPCAVILKPPMRQKRGRQTMMVRGAAVALTVLGLAACSSLPWEQEEEQRADEGVVGKPGTAWQASEEAEASPEFSEAPWQEARARGAEIRAIGQEPGWWLEIRRDGTMMLASDYGTRRQVFERPRAQLLEGNVERFHVAEAGVMVTLTELYCEDVMSGEPMPLTVVVETPDEQLEGCGRRLAEEARD